MLQSYHNDEQLKKDFVKEVMRHRKMDMVIQGTYGSKNAEDFKGCAVGCSIHSLNILLNKNIDTDDHAAYEDLLGVPEWLARLEDRIFEGLPTEDAMKWPEQFAKAIPVGVNLEPVKWRFSAFLLKENIDRVLSLDISDELKKQVVDAIRGVLNVHQEAIKTGEWNESAAKSAAWSAESAAWSARSAAESAAWSAKSAAWSQEAIKTGEWNESAAWSAESAAWSARSAARSAESAAESAARSAESAAYKKYAKELLRLLKTAK